MQYSIINYSHHAVYYIAMTYLFYNRKFVPKKQNILSTPETSLIFPSSQYYRPPLSQRLIIILTSSSTD